MRALRHGVRESLQAQRGVVALRWCASCFGMLLVGVSYSVARAQLPLDVRPTSLWLGPAAQPSAVLELQLQRPLEPPARITLWDASGMLVGELQPDRNVAGETLYATLPWPADAETVRVAVAAHETKGATSLVVHVPKPDPQWVLHLIPGFHFDPVWWNSQANYTETGARMGTDVAPGHTLVEEYLQAGRADARLRVALHDLPYLKTYVEARPWAARDLQRAIRNGQIDVVGGTYDEVSSTLVSAEAIARNAIYGVLFQRDVLGGAGRVFWQCDVFGHDPSFPSLMVHSGHTAGAFARGPFHQWGAPRAQVNFPSEFWWMAPDGEAILTHYMTGHYGYAAGLLETAAAAWAAARDSAAAGALANSRTLRRWEEPLARACADLQRPAATHQVMLPMQADFARPVAGLADVVAAWNARFLAPRVEISTPDRFFAAVRAEVEERKLELPVITRDMNPIYTGCQVSFADLKTVERQCESVLRDAEMLATWASLEGARYPWASLDRAWRQLLFAAHHDAVTGSMSDQVYVDLLYVYRDALEIATAVRDRAMEFLSARCAPGASALRWNTVASARDGVPAVGWTADAVTASPDVATPAPVPPTASLVHLENEFLAASIDLEHGGALASLRDKQHDRELLRGFGNDVVLCREYAELPGQGEGPWHLSPTGERRAGSSVRARWIAPDAATSHQVIVEATFPEYIQRQTYTLLPGSQQLDLATEIRAWRGANQLLRVEFPLAVPGARPVHATAAAVVGRPFARDVDAAQDPWTLDEACGQWADLGTTCVLEVQRGAETLHRRALGVGEIVMPAGSATATLADAGRLARALVRCGVTTTITRADQRRYGDLRFDSNLPDFRVACGDPQVLFPLLGAPAPAGPARLCYFESSADSLLPVLGIADAATLEAVLHMLEQGASIQVAAADARVAHVQQVADYGVAILNRGSVSVHTGRDGTLALNLMRSCTGWPAGVWIDGPTRRLPDGAPFETLHGTARFEYALRPHAGDWRHAELPRWAHAYNQPLLACAGSAPPAAAAQAASATAAAHGSFVEVDPPGVLVAALKPAGYPAARWDASEASAGPPNRVALRLWNGTGRRVQATVRLQHLRGGAWRADLLEQRGARLAVRAGRIHVPLEPHAFETVLCEVRAAPFGLPRHAAAASVSLEAPIVADSLAADPSAYWRENRGEGTSANGTLSLAPEQHMLALVHGVGGVRVHVANHDRRQPATVQLTLTADPALRARLDRTELVVPPDDSRAVLVLVEGPPHPGAYRSVLTLRAVSTLGTAVTACVWAEAGEPSTAAPLSIDSAARVVASDGTLRATIHNHSDGEVTGEAAWLAPQIDWPALPRWRCAVHIPARGQVEVTCPLRQAPASWALLRCTAAGKIAYGEPVAIFPDSQSVLLRTGTERLRVREASAAEFTVTAASVRGLDAASPLQLVAGSNWSLVERARRFSTPAATTQLAIDVIALPHPGARDTTIVVRGPHASETKLAVVVVPVQHARPRFDAVTVDGDLGEWHDAEFTTASSTLGEVRGAVRWGEAGLACAFAVRDGNHVQTHYGADLWAGDSVQLGLTLAPADAIGYDARVLEYGAARTPDGPLVWCYYGGEGGRTGRLTDAPSAVRVAPDGWTCYEIVLPRAALAGVRLAPGNVLGFSYIANDDDGAGFHGAVEWTRGMSGGKDASLFGDLVLEKE